MTLKKLQFGHNLDKNMHQIWTSTSKLYNNRHNRQKAQANVDQEKDPKKISKTNCEI